jgi:general nucleoside transport system permease protein
MIYSTIEIMTPFLIAALGGLFTERAGMLNIALEGLILNGAFAAVVITSFTGSIWLGILAGILSSLLLSLLFGTVSLYLKTNIFISGLAVNLLAAGLVTMFSTLIFETKGVVRLTETTGTAAVRLFTGLQEVPLVGAFLFGHSLFFYSALVLLFITYRLLYRTAFGLRLQAAGLAPRTLTARGSNPLHYQLSAILISGAFCGFAGANLVIRLGAFVPNISGGRGWIALVAIYLGRKHPGGILIAAFCFALAEAVTNRVQGSAAIPGTVVLSFPYIATFLGLVLVSILYKKKT